jgi:hypothetical protein
MVSSSPCGRATTSTSFPSSAPGEPCRSGPSRSPRSACYSPLATDVTLARVTQAGAIPTDTFATLAEFMSTWNRPDAMDFAVIMKDHIVPHYQLLFESYDKAQRVQKEGHETKLDRLGAR